MQTYPEVDSIQETWSKQIRKEEGGVQGDSQVPAWVGWVRMTLWSWDHRRRAGCWGKGESVSVHLAFEEPLGLPAMGC